MRKLIEQPVGRFVLQAIIISILFPTLLLAWSRRPPEPEPIKLVTAPLCFKSVRPSSSLLDADIVELARRYQKISDAQTGFTKQQMVRLREIRPDIYIDHYMNLSAVFGWKKELVLRDHPDWAMRDAAGNPLPSLWTHGGLLMDPNSWGWREYLVQEASQFINYNTLFSNEDIERWTKQVAEGELSKEDFRFLVLGKKDLTEMKSSKEIRYDGIMGDAVVMCGKLPSDFTGINTDTGRPYTIEEYRCHQLEVVKAVKSVIGEKTLILNSVLRGFFYFKEKPYSFLDAADGVVAEGFRGSTHWALERHISETAWLANIEMMQDVQSRGKKMVVIVKVTKKVADQYTSQKLKRWELFWYCTFLLGLQDSAYYAASITDPMTRGGKTALFYPHHEIDLGKPLDEFTKTGKGYMRTFERVWVYVDLTKHEGIIIRKWPRIQDEENTE